MESALYGLSTIIMLSADPGLRYGRCIVEGRLPPCFTSVILAALLRPSWWAGLPISFALRLIIINLLFLLEDALVKLRVDFLIGQLHA